MAKRRRGRGEDYGKSGVPGRSWVSEVYQIGRHAAHHETVDACSVVYREAVHRYGVVENVSRDVLDDRRRVV
jgi:hypothetical protein